ncbi:hypothetical protein Tco_0034709, partial [Tanacetum coccineum]
VQGRHEHDMEPDFEFTTVEEVYTTEKKVSTTEPVSTVGASVSTAGASSAKDKGKAIMEEAETIRTKTKLQLEQERLGYEEALRLQAKIDEEERDYNKRKERCTMNLKKQDCLQSLSMRERDTLEDLVKLWSLVKEKFTSTKPTEDKEREICVDLKRLFEPDTYDELWKLQKHIHDNLT